MASRMMDLELLIKRHEGWRDRPYEDSGDLSIGYGRNLTQNGISEAEGMLMLRNDITRVMKGIRMVNKMEGWSSARQAAVISMGYNLGLVGLFGFVKMWKCLEKRDWHGAAKEMLDSKWATQVGRRAEQLSDMMKTGEWV